MSQKGHIICKISDADLVDLLDLVEVGHTKKLEVLKKELGAKYGYEYDKVTINSLGEVRKMDQTA